MIDSLRAGLNGKTWETTLSNKWGRIARENDNGVTYTGTVAFIKYDHIPQERDVIYVSFIFDNRPLKSKQWRERIVVGGDRLSYEDSPGSPTASLLETKILINTVISDAKCEARFICLNFKIIFLLHQLHDQNS